MSHIVVKADDKTLGFIVAAQPDLTVEGMARQVLHIGAGAGAVCGSLYHT